MSEQEYINATDLGKIRAALAALAMVVPENSKVYSKEDFYKATSILYDIQDKLSEVVKTTT